MSQPTWENWLAARAGQTIALTFLARGGDVLATARMRDVGMVDDERPELRLTWPDGQVVVFTIEGGCVAQDDYLLLVEEGALPGRELRPVAWIHLEVEPYWEATPEEVDP